MLTRSSSALLAATSCLVLHAQITFEYTDLAVPGDVIERYVDTIPAFDAGGDGVAQLWDFSAAVPDEVATTTVSTAAGTPYASGFATSNVAMTNDGVNYLYFNATPSSLIATGVAGDFLNDGQQLVIPFAPALLSHQFPRDFEDHFSHNYAFDVVASGTAFSVHSVRLRHRGLVRDTTDAYGQITTPTGTYNALRVKTIDTATDSIWIRLFSFAPWSFLQASQGTTTSYSWLTKETKLAVAEMTFDSLGAPARFTYTSIPPSISTGIAASPVAQVELFPSPAQDTFTLRLREAGAFHRVQVLSSDGKIMDERSMAQRNAQTFDTSAWASGVYHVRLWPAGNEAPLVLRAMVAR